MAFSENPVERHREIAAGFSARVEGAPDWDAPAPVEGWAARDVVEHLVTWIRGFLADGGVDLPPVPLDDPARAWASHVAMMQALLETSGTADFTHRHAGSGRLADIVDRFYTSDVFMHTWDLARATGQDETLDPDFAGQLLTGMQPIEDLLRNSGQYGPAMPVAPDAPVYERLMAFVGRDVIRAGGTSDQNV